MNKEEKELKQRVSAVIHLGIVVPSIEKALEVYQNQFGLTPWEHSEKNEFFADKLVNGKVGIEFKSAIYRSKEMEIELIEPTVDSIYKEWLAQHGPGIHHIKFATDYSYSELMTTSNRPPYLEYAWPNGVPIVGYADFLKDAGILIEISHE